MPILTHIAACSMLVSRVGGCGRFFVETLFLSIDEWVHGFGLIFFGAPVSVTIIPPFGSNGGDGAIPGTSGRGCNVNGLPQTAAPPLIDGKVVGSGVVKRSCGGGSPNVDKLTVFPPPFAGKIFSSGKLNISFI